MVISCNLNLLHVTYAYKRWSHHTWRRIIRVKSIKDILSVSIPIKDHWKTMKDTYVPWDVQIQCLYNLYDWFYLIVIKIIFKFINIFMIIFLTKSIEKLLPIHDFSLKYHFRNSKMILKFWWKPFWKKIFLWKSKFFSFYMSSLCP